MNKIKLCFLGFVLFVVGILVFGCTNKEVGNTYKITLVEGYEYVFDVGDEDIDFTKYFRIVDSKGNEVKVTNEMLDLSDVDLTKKGLFMVTIEYENKTLSLVFNVNEKIEEEKLTTISIIDSKDIAVSEELQLNISTTPTSFIDEVKEKGVWKSSNEGVITVSNGLVKAIKVGSSEISVEYNGIIAKVTINVVAKETPVDLSAVFDNYNSYDKWNFLAEFYVLEDGQLAYDYFYYFDGDNIKASYSDEYGTYNDYIILNDDGIYTYYLDCNPDPYEAYEEGTEDFDYYYSYIDILELCELNNYEFVVEGDHYKAVDPQTTACGILGDYEGDEWKYLNIYINDGKITRIVAEDDYTDEDGTYRYKYDIKFSQYDSVEIKQEDYSNDDENPDEGSKVSSFTDVKLTTTGEIKYSSDISGTNFDTNRGIQFLQTNGEVIISSTTSVNGVMSVTLTLATNQDLGMSASVKVGTQDFFYQGVKVADISKTDYNVINEYVFSYDQAVDGVIEITLIPKATSKSMYISCVTVSGTKVSQGDISNEMMPTQDYNASTVGKTTLQDELYNNDGAIGLPSIGTYSCLVVPIQFTDTTVTNSDLEKLNKAFNGTETDTGWESVRTYYQKSSYGKLNISYDIQSVYLSTKSSNYYETYTREVSLEDGGSYTQDGGELLLLEVLAYLEPLMDLSKYDSDNDGIIDAVYLIYSADVEYDDDSSIYWAYVSWYATSEAENKTFDNLDAYYYLFAGFDFMDEDVPGGYQYEETIDNLIINPSTYIHETGHLLGLDDYYDYSLDQGSDEGLGGADIMDSTVGDHNAYSKLMLGWVEPIVITSDQDITINNFESSGDFLIVLLDYNGTYFSEYLIIDLYSATGINELHASVNNSYLYDGAEYGVRIYHISSDISNPYNDEYGSFTTYNNSTSKYSLIKLVEADGESKFSSTDGFAYEKDLWTTGDVFSKVYPNYTRNDGLKINFDIAINSVSQSQASITISFLSE